MNSQTEAQEANCLESDLMISVQAGDQDAYQQLLDKHLTSVGQFAFRMLHNAADAEDITQEVFVRLWLKAKYYDPAKARLSTWLHQIAHNLCIDLIRKRKPNDDIELEALSSETSSEQTLIQGLNEDRRKQDLETAMSLLAPKQRSAIIMTHYQGLSNKQTAHILDLSVDALESLLSRGRRKLRKSLANNAAPGTQP